MKRTPALDELEELCNPFIPNLHQKRYQRPPKLYITPPRGPLPTYFLPTGSGLQHLPPPHQLRQPHQHTVPHKPRAKRRKNLKKKVVCQVPADCPTTPLKPSMEDELLMGCKKEEGEEVEEEAEEDEENSLLMEDMEMMNEEDMLFLGLEELQELAAGALAAFPDFSAAFPDFSAGQ